MPSLQSLDPFAASAAPAGGRLVAVGYVLRLDGPGTALVRDHAVNGMALLSAAAMFELLCWAGAAMLDNGDFVVAGVAIASALVLSQGDAVPRLAVEAGMLGIQGLVQAEVARLAAPAERITHSAVEQRSALLPLAEPLPGNALSWLSPSPHASASLDASIHLAPAGAAEPAGTKVPVGVGAFGKVTAVEHGDWASVREILADEVDVRGGETKLAGLLARAAASAPAPPKQLEA